MQTLPGSSTVQTIQPPSGSSGAATSRANANCLVWRHQDVAFVTGIVKGVNALQIAAGESEGFGVVGNSVLGYSSFGHFHDLDGNVVLSRFTWFGDCNLDGNVDAADYTMFQIDLNNQANFGTSAYDANFVGWAYGDFNYDGVVDGTDSDLMELGYEGWLASLGQEDLLTASPGAVSEPGTILLIGCAFAAVIAKRRRVGR
jgi:hypothetical protein